MAYDEGLAERIRTALKDQNEVTEKPRFGGLTFMHRGHMCCGVSGDELMLRVGAEKSETAAKEPYARPCDFTGRPMKGLITVKSPGFADDRALKQWVAMALDFTASLPPK